MTSRALARLVHDVGKYVARTARNLPEVPTREMIDMLSRDLYELRPGRRASQVFADLIGADASPRLNEVRTLLGEIDAIEASVRNGDRVAVRRAAAAACAVEHALRALLNRT